MSGEVEAVQAGDVAHRVVDAVTAGWQQRAHRYPNSCRLTTTRARAEQRATAG
ncbi:hypothetical protein [Streptomyces sp. NPDC059378]|uniref:hypothetical protein n=1 Tax=Streptomyces sp. NPDC059378 TaxID=3346815 RepID=UPI00368D5275